MTPFIASFSPADVGVSVIVPVLNGAATVRAALAALMAECDGRATGAGADLSPRGQRRPFEIIVVDDGSTDASTAIVDELRSEAIRRLAGARRGAAAAINLGLQAARFPVIAQVDQDVIVEHGWLAALLDALAAPGVAAAQGWYIADRHASLPERVMALDLEQRYRRIPRGGTDHVCTGNVVWRRDAILAVGGLDETLGYGYDNDLSYRLVQAGYRLVICPGARSVHRWREGWAGYFRQQYGFGYGRLDLVARHRGRLLGDRVSPAPMMAHPVVAAIALAHVVAAAALVAVGRSPVAFLSFGGVLLAALALERLVSGTSAALRTRDSAGLLFPVVHLLRDLVWVAAMARWAGRRLTGTSPAPRHSMRPRAPREGAERTGGAA